MISKWIDRKVENKVAIISDQLAAHFRKELMEFSKREAREKKQLDLYEKSLKDHFAHAKEIEHFLRQFIEINQGIKKVLEK